jgi:hypothetical protein
MGEALYILIGVAASGLFLFLSKFFGGDKGETVAGQDSPRAQAAADKAAELLGRRAMVEAKADADKEKIEKTMAIEDPVERLEAIAKELESL